jgi:CheY-like chemotaxis protein
MKTVLVVEDNEAIRVLIKFLLERDGHHVETASGGEEALQRAAERRPDLILMDVMMKGTGGYEVCRILKKEEATRSIPVILVSAKGQKKEQEEGFGAGAAAYVVKPFDPEEILSLVRGILHKSAVA